ncbi:hypothetical protein K8Z61_09480 [Nocardioides sp. TRM66260-LWL]|uniref:hypothetical protein n=1 Tax=Nocardioides sp. TRM66260-LWL TaxID=2874478 RepID=UPI001CC4C662|nr:hypothetical protein [Nocardioides sp. TRM66260-LWL]MBZ5734726.1 hypothetical protein [Nocardioides sp. TRM66260-LWL]
MRHLASASLAVVLAGGPMLLPPPALADDPSTPTLRVLPGHGDWTDTPALEGPSCSPSAATSTVTLRGPSLRADALVAPAELARARRTASGDQRVLATSFAAFFHDTGVAPVVGRPYVVAWTCRDAGGRPLTTVERSVTFERTGDSLAFRTLPPASSGASASASAVDPASASQPTPSPTPSPSAAASSPARPATTTAPAVTTAPPVTVRLRADGPTSRWHAARFTAIVPAGSRGVVRLLVDGRQVRTARVAATGRVRLVAPLLRVGTHPVRAVFVPADRRLAPVASRDVSQIVAADPERVVAQTLRVEVQPGALTISVPDTSDGQVALGQPVLDQSGGQMVASGSLDPIVVSDTRAGDPGWTASGSVTDFVQTRDATQRISGYDLGWTPTMTSVSSNQAPGFALGPRIRPALVAAGGIPADPDLGLHDSRILATATADHGSGTAYLGADLLLQVPTETPPGRYVATLTITVG